MSTMEVGMSTELNKDNLEEMYHREFLSIREIAELLESDKSVIHKRMIKLGIPRRKTHELKPDYKDKIPCEICGEQKLRFGKYKICKNCWDKENGRERYPGGTLIPLRLMPRPKRKFKACLHCRGEIASWNKSGYCGSCYKLPGMKKYIAKIFCKKCGKFITGHGATGKCSKCSQDRQSNGD